MTLFWSCLFVDNNQNNLKKVMNMLPFFFLLVYSKCIFHALMPGAVAEQCFHISCAARTGLSLLWEIELIARGNFIHLSPALYIILCCFELNLEIFPSSAMSLGFLKTA